MTARTLTYKLMVMAPLVLIGSIAAQSRLFVDPYSPVNCTSIQQADITAYIGPVQATQPLLERGHANVSADKVRQIAQVWIDGEKSQKLRPLLPSYYEDSLRSPVKSQIKDANDAVITSLTALARKEASSGDATAAVKDYTRSLQVAEILKYSDPYAVAVEAGRQRAILMRIRDLLPSIDPKAKTELKDNLYALRDQRQPMDALARMAETQYTLWCERKGVKPVCVEHNSNLVSTREPEKSVASFAATNIQVASVRHIRPPFYAELRLGTDTELKYGESVDSLLKTVQEQTPTPPVF